MGSREALWTEVLNRTASTHFIGGITIGELADQGVVDPYHRAFGYPGLHVIDGSVSCPPDTGVNPRLMITGLAERRYRFGPTRATRIARFARLRSTARGSGQSRRTNLSRPEGRSGGAPTGCKDKIIPLYPF